MSEEYINYSFFFKKMKGAYIDRFKMAESILKFSLKKLASEWLSLSTNIITSSILLHYEEHMREWNASKHYLLNEEAKHKP